ncbi:acyl-CoA thioesterase [Jatrophihabitans sp. DSM 45814]
MSAGHFQVDDTAHLIKVLDLHTVGAFTYRASSPRLHGRNNVFGGQVMAQALRAASYTVDEDRFVHSLHASFLREGRFDEDILLTVTPTRDGRSFSSRHVAAHQGGREIFTMQAAFHTDEGGVDFQSPSAMREPPPDDLDAPTTAGRGFSDAIQLVESSEPGGVGGRAGPADRVHAWLRSRSALPRDRSLHACVLAYMSDARTGAAAGHYLRTELSSGEQRIMMTSLDHAMWFHRAARADAWIHVDTILRSMASSRSLVSGTMHDKSGVHLASFSQELLTRQLASAR